jgi:hypothetical protein
MAKQHKTAGELPRKGVGHQAKATLAFRYGKLDYDTVQEMGGSAVHLRYVG